MEHPIVMGLYANGKSIGSVRKVLGEYKKEVVPMSFEEFEDLLEIKFLLWQREHSAIGKHKSTLNKAIKRMEELLRADKNYDLYMERIALTN